MILLLAALCGSVAHAGEPPTELTWELTVNGRRVGQRTLTVRTEQLRELELRTLQARTSVDATVLGMQLAFEQKLTANADIGPASFISVVDQGGRLTEIQGRRTYTGWLVTQTSEGRSRTEDWPRDAIDLSTADLLDPESRVPLSRFQTARILYTETGDVVSGTVEPLGPAEVQVAGESVAVEGYRWTADEQAAFAYTAWYTSEGWLVRFESKRLGQELAGTLTAPPPAGPDSEPIDVFGPRLDTVEL